MENAALQADRYWMCEHDTECGLVIEGRSIVTCQACWAEIENRES